MWETVPSFSPTFQATILGFSFQNHKIWQEQRQKNKKLVLNWSEIFSILFLLSNSFALLLWVIYLCSLSIVLVGYLTSICKSSSLSICYTTLCMLLIFLDFLISFKTLWYLSLYNQPSISTVPWMENIRQEKESQQILPQRDLNSITCWIHVPDVVCRHTQLSFLLVQSLSPAQCSSNILHIWYSICAVSSLRMHLYWSYIGSFSCR